MSAAVTPGRYADTTVVDHAYAPREGRAGRSALTGRSLVHDRRTCSVLSGWVRTSAGRDRRAHRVAPTRA